MAAAVESSTRRGARRGVRVPTLRAVLAAILVSLAGLVVAAPVSAHTAFEFSTPPDGEAVDTPVGQIVISFTAAATPSGDEFVVLDPNGAIRTPSSVEVSEDRIFTLGFDPPLAGGDVGVRWSVRAGDAHPITGSFSFTVTAPLPTAAPATTATDTVAADSVAADSSNDEAVAEEGVEASAPAPVAADADDVGTTGDRDVLTAPGTDETGAAETGVPVSLDEFLTVDESVPGEATARIGRIVSFTAA